MTDITRITYSYDWQEFNKLEINLNNCPICDKKLVKVKVLIDSLPSYYSIFCPGKRETRAIVSDSEFSYFRDYKDENDIAFNYKFGGYGIYFQYGNVILVSIDGSEDNMIHKTTKPYNAPMNKNDLLKLLDKYRKVRVLA